MSHFNYEDNEEMVEGGGGVCYEGLQACFEVTLECTDAFFVVGCTLLWPLKPHW